jgi:hypothetical protein
MVEVEGDVEEEVEVEGDVEEEVEVEAEVDVHGMPCQRGRMKMKPF